MQMELLADVVRLSIPDCRWVMKSVGLTNKSEKRKFSDTGHEAKESPGFFDLVAESPLALWYSSDFRMQKLNSAT